MEKFEKFEKFADLNCIRSWIVAKDALKIRVIGTTNASEQFLSKIGWSLSAPHALFKFRQYHIIADIIRLKIFKFRLILV